MDITHLRDRVLPTWQSVEDVDPMAMVLVVNSAHDAPVEEQAVLGAAVKAVAALLLDEDEESRRAIELWLSGRIRKIVKRARNKAWSDLSNSELHHTLVSHGGAQVYAFAPQHVSKMLPQLRKLQVSGLEFPVAKAEISDFHGLEILIDSKLSLSTGKAVAQVCHAAQLFMMNADLKHVSRWIEEGFPTKFCYADDLEAETRQIEVRDAGFTEVAPNTLTCAARYV